MDIYEAIRARYSVRSYQDREVEQDKLHRVLEAGLMSPSARNRQQRKFVVVSDAKTRQDIAKAADQPFLAEAPIIIAVVGLTPDYIMHCDVPADPVDCAIAIDHMTLAAAAEGLGSCWIGHFDQHACRKILGMPESAKIIELLPLGYPADDGKEKPRRPFEEIVCFEKFQ